MVILGIDYGTKRIGVAASDNEARVAFAVGSLDQQRGLKAQLEGILRLHPAEKIVVGEPLDFAGRPAQIHAKAVKFAEKVSRWFGIECVLWDERYTSAMADSARETFTEKEHRDTASAVLILQSYIDYRNRSEGAVDDQSETGDVDQT